MNLTMLESMMKPNTSYIGGNLMEVSPELLRRAATIAHERSKAFDRYTKQATTPQMHVVGSSQSLLNKQMAAKFVQGMNKRLGKAHVDLSNDALRKMDPVSYVKLERARRIKSTVNQTIGNIKRNFVRGVKVGTGIAGLGLVGKHIMNRRAAAAEAARVANLKRIGKIGLAGVTAAVIAKKLMSKRKEQRK